MPPMPNTFDAAAPQMAAGTLPRAMAVNAIDDVTADGNAPRYKNPVPSAAGNNTGASQDTGSTTHGKTMNVIARIATCSRH